MHTTLLRTLAASALLAIQLAALAQENTRLLPDTMAKTIAVQWKQDGRAVDMKLANPVGTWVVTSILL